MKSFFSLQPVALALLTACIAAIGCSAADSVQTADVEGQVQLDGQPLSDVIVRFYSPSGGGGGFTTTADGSFKSETPIKTGVYTVALVAPAAAPGGGSPTSGPLAKVPAHFWSVQHSSLEAEVTSGGPNKFAFNISSSEKPPAGFKAPKPAAKVPAGPMPVSSDS